MVAWHEVPGMAADYDPSRRDGMIEYGPDDVSGFRGSSKKTQASVKLSFTPRNRQSSRPSGTDPREQLPRHFVPGYHLIVPPGHKSRSPNQSFNKSARLSVRRLGARKKEDSALKARKILRNRAA